VGARSSSSKYPQPPQQQQRAPGELRQMQPRDKIGFVPVDLLYSESLTKSTKKYQKVLLQNACQKWSQIYHKTSRRFLNRSQK
jgi:hypothetical protein